MVLDAGPKSCRRCALGHRDQHVFDPLRLHGFEQLALLLAVVRAHDIELAGVRTSSSGRIGSRGFALWRRRRRFGSLGDSRSCNAPDQALHARAQQQIVRHAAACLARWPGSSAAPDNAAALRAASSAAIRAPGAALRARDSPPCDRDEAAGRSISSGRSSSRGRRRRAAGRRSGDPARAGSDRLWKASFGTACCRWPALRFLGFAAPGSTRKRPQRAGARKVLLVFMSL